MTLFENIATEARLTIFWHKIEVEMSIAPKSIFIDFNKTA